MRREVELSVTAIGRSLWAAGCRRGDRVGVMGPNSPEWIKIMLVRLGSSGSSM